MRRYHRSDWLSRLNQGGALLAIGSEEKPLLLTENAERLKLRNLPYGRVRKRIGMALCITWPGVHTIKVLLSVRRHLNTHMTHLQ